MLGDVEHFRIDQGIAVDKDIPVVAVFTPEFVDLKLLVNDRPFRKLTLADNMKIRSDLSRIRLYERVSERADFGRIIPDIERVNGLLHGP